MKPGYQTTEFWLVLIPVVGPILQRVTGVDIVGTQDDITAAVSAVITAIYTVGRLLTKWKAIAATASPPVVVNNSTVHLPISVPTPPVPTDPPVA
jgi:hypothetical protein